MDSDYVECKFCKEVMLTDAVFCPHCIKEVRPAPATHNFFTILVFIAVIVGCLYVIVPHGGQKNINHTQKLHAL